MIRVDRGAQPRPPELDRTDKKGKTEAQRADAHFNANPRPEGGFTFSAYSDRAVSDALNALFHFKCAYCESRYKAMAPVDVEHYRPKGRILVSTGPRVFKDGYWWLASEWTNLLASCIDCNRARWHEVDEAKQEELYGKADRFPLFAEEDRATGNNGKIDERPLLLNPCECDPGDYLSFGYVEGESIVSPIHPDDGSYDYERARKSIDIFGLNRPGLVDERTERLDRARGWLKRIRKSCVRLSDPNRTDHDELKESIADDMDELKAFTKRTAIWSAAIRAHVLPQLQALGVDVGDLADD